MIKRRANCAVCKERICSTEPCLSVNRILAKVRAGHEIEIPMPDVEETTRKRSKGWGEDLDAWSMKWRAAKAEDARMRTEATAVLEAKQRKREGAKTKVPAPPLGDDAAKLRGRLAARDKGRDVKRLKDELAATARKLEQRQRISKRKFTIRKRDR